MFAAASCMQQRQRRSTASAGSRVDMTTKAVLCWAPPVVCLTIQAPTCALMHESTETVIKRELPAEQAENFLQARAAYLQARYAEALALDQKILQWAEHMEHVAGKILGHRFVGLCHFRLDQPKESEEHLRRAIDLAESANAMAQVLLCANHLGATLRRQGRLYDAYQLFRQYLEKATLPTFLHERARLLGNLGALYDVLGQRAARDDHYARMEELCELLGNPDRLANARGLAARSLLQRKDLDGALKKFEQEQQLAEQSGNVARQVAATTHIATLRAQRHQWDDALALSQRAIDQATALQHCGRMIDAWECRAAVLLLQGNLAASYGALQKAFTLLAQVNEHHEKQANVRNLAARLCIRAGLHGEALHHLMIEVDLRYRLLEPLRKDDKIRQMAQRPIRALRRRADYLLRETWSVARRPQEQEAVKKLLYMMLDRGDLSDDEIAQQFSGVPSIDLRRWQRIQQRRARTIWQERLLPGTFALLHTDSQRDLLRAEVSYSAAVDDLARFAHLLAIVVERELRERIIRPAIRTMSLGSVRREWMKLGLGGLLSLLEGQTPKQPALQRNAPAMLDYIRGVRAKHAQVFAAIRTIGQPVHRADPIGNKFTLVDLRNAVAHGSDSGRYKNLDRLTVDAIKRRLVLDGDAPLLAQLTELPLPPIEPEAEG